MTTIAMMWMILKIIGMGCLIVLAALVLMVLITLFVAVAKTLKDK